jgi:hypothetical protein
MARSPHLIDGGGRDVRAGQAAVPVHPWDVHGAKAAGLTTAYVSAERPLRWLRSDGVKTAGGGIPRTPFVFEA